MYSHSVSFVMAGYNEAENVIPAVGEAWQVLHNNFTDFEIILVNDGSKDSTLEKMEQCVKKYPNVRLLDNLVNLNFGTSVLRGIKAAQKDYVVYNAFDLPLRPLDFVEKFEEMVKQDSDVLVLQRVSYPCTLWRKIASNVNVIMLRILFPVLTRKTPILNFTQIYRRSILDDIMPLARSPIFVWPELVFRAKHKGLRVDNIMAVPYVKNLRKGAFGHPHDIIWGIYDMLRFRIRLWSKNI